MARNSSEKKYTMRWEEWRIAKTSEAKTNSIVYDVPGEGWNSVLFYNFTSEFFLMKRSRESFSHNFLWRWKQAHVFSSRGTAYLWDKNRQVNLKIQWVQDTLEWESGTKEVWTPNVVLFSELRESRVMYCPEDSGDMSLRDACLGKPRNTNKRSFNLSNIDTRCKGDNGKGIKGRHKEGTQKQNVRKVHIVALMDIRHIQKYEYVPGNVRESNLKCGN